MMCGLCYFVMKEAFSAVMLWFKEQTENNFWKPQADTSWGFKEFKLSKIKHSTVKQTSKNGLWFVSDNFSQKSQLHDKNSSKHV